MKEATISVIMPTLNSGKTIRNSLDSILSQNYSSDKIEIIIADAGSKDNTLEIVRSLCQSTKVRINLIHNRLKTGEAGKAEGLKLAKNEIMAFIDSDNILPEQDWLTKMVEPFNDSQILASEPLYYTYRKEDSYITRYCSLIGMNDPICLFLGNYDRYSFLTARWTEMPVSETDKGFYKEVGFLGKRLPTMGANGFLIRREQLLDYPLKEYLFDIDVMQYLYLKNPGIKVAKVKIGIIHIFSSNLAGFISKQSRRFKDYTYYSAMGLRNYNWLGVSRIRLVKFVLYTLFCIPLIFQAIKGYLIKRDAAWFFHPLACWITLLVYSCLFLKNLFFPLKPKKR